MALLSIVYPPKTPDETYIISIDFAADLNAGETITTRTVTATRLRDGGTATSDFLDGAPGGGETSKCTMRIKAGTSGETYRVKMVVVTSQANTYEAEVDIPVEIP